MKSSNDYFLEMDDRGEYLYALAAGDQLTAQISAAYWNEIAGKCFELEKTKILIEKDFEKGVGPSEMLLMADHVSNLLPGCHIAFIDRRGADDVNELGKKLARNRNLMMQIFNSVEDAEKWLLAN